LIATMRLLFIDFTLPHLLTDDAVPAGGWAVQLEQWLNGLSQAGVESGVLTWKGANAHVPSQQPFALLETYDPARGVRVLKYFYSHIPALLAAARAFRPDAIVQSARSLHTGIMAHIAGRLGVPFVYRIASDADVDARHRNGLALYERLAFRHGLARADLVICQNAYQLERMKDAFPKKPRLLIRNTIAIESGAASARPRGARDCVAWLGNFRGVKNMPLLLKVAQNLPDIPFRVAGVAVAGADHETRTAVDALGKLPNVRFEGYLRRGEVAGFLSRAMALLCTSHLEGFSNTFLEAFAVGTPVITRKGVDPDSIIERHGLGQVAQDDSELATHISQLFALDPAAYDALAQRCRDYVEANHAPLAAMQGLKDAVGSLLVRHDAGGT
jgi:glycosyltransferase involved in cell wall biosynthesis